VLRDVYCVIEGLSVDGVSPLPKAVSFPKRREVVDAAVSLAQVLYMIVGATQRALAEDHAARTAIVFKLLAHLTRTGRVTPEAIRAGIQDVVGIASVLSERPELIAASVNFANVLSRHVQAERERAAKRAKVHAERDAAPPPTAQPIRRDRRLIVDGSGHCDALALHTQTGQLRAARPRRAPVADCAEPSGPVPSRPVVWRSIDGEYCLQELTDPRHLVEETKALGHCVGRHGASSGSSGRSIKNLTYWRYIRYGHSRIFSFARNRGPHAGPLCTLHVQLPNHVLVEAGPRVPRVLTGAESYFAALVASLDGLEANLGRSLCIGNGPSLDVLRRWRDGDDEAAELRRVRHRRRRPPD
jgi:hypothetical protein